MKHPQRNHKRPAGQRPCFVGHLQPDRQGKVAAGFHCNACGEDRTRVGGAFECQPYPPMAVCRPCYARAKNDVAFRHRAEDRVRGAAPAEFARHLADHLQRPTDELERVISAGASPAEWDTALGLPAGSSDAAISRITGAGAIGAGAARAIGAGAARQIPQRVRDAVLATAGEVAPMLGISAQQLAESMLSHPDFEQLIAEARVIHQRDLLAARRH